MPNHLSILVADTHKKSFQIALQNSHGKRFFLQSDKPLSSHFLPLIQNFLHKHNYDIKTIDCFGIIQGPGSFTGIRIGMIVFKTLSFLSKNPCYGVNTLEILACQAQSSQQILSIIDAYQKKFFFQLFDKYKRTITQPKCSSLENLLVDINEDTTIIGLGCDSYQNLIKTIGGKKNVSFSFVKKIRIDMNAFIDQTELMHTKNKNSSYKDISPLYVISRKYQS